MSNFLENCRVYLARVYEKKSGYYYTFSVVAESKPEATRLVQEYAAGAIGNTCKIKKITKLPNKAQVVDFYRE